MGSKTETESHSGLIDQRDRVGFFISVRWLWLLLAVAIINIASIIVARWAFFRGGELDATKIPTGDIDSTVRAMLISFCLTVPLLTGHAIIHYLSIEEQSENVGEAELIETLLKEGEIGERMKGFRNLANILRLFAYIFAALGVGLATKILLVILFRY